MSDIYTRLVANALFPLQERLKKHDTVKVRQAMEESQWWPQQRILEQQAARQLQPFVDGKAAIAVETHDLHRGAQVAGAAPARIAYPAGRSGIDVKRAPVDACPLEPFTVRHLECSRSAGLLAYGSTTSRAFPIEK